MGESSRVSYNWLVYFTYIFRVESFCFNFSLDIVSSQGVHFGLWKKIVKSRSSENSLFILSIYEKRELYKFYPQQLLKGKYPRRSLGKWTFAHCRATIKFGVFFSLTSLDFALSFFSNFVYCMLGLFRCFAHSTFNYQLQMIGL